MIGSGLVSSFEPARRGGRVCRQAGLVEKRKDVVSTELDQRFAVPKLAPMKELNHYPVIPNIALSQKPVL